MYILQAIQTNPESANSTSRSGHFIEPHHTTPHHTTPHHTTWWHCTLDGSEYGQAEPWREVATFLLLRNLKSAETSLGSHSSRGRREHLLHLHPCTAPGLRAPSREEERAQGEPSSGGPSASKPGKLPGWRGPACRPAASFRSLREKVSESLMDSLVAFDLRRNSANRSLELTEGAMERGEEGEENSSGRASAACLARATRSCFSRVRRRPKVKGEVARETLGGG